MDLGAAYDWIAVALAPVVALATLRSSRPALIVPMVIGVGCAMWALLLLSSAWFDAQAVAAFNEIPNPSPQQIRDFSADGATKTMLFVFGLPFSLCYTGIWFVFARLARRLKQRMFHA
jgi:hypothetical protein